MSQHPNPPDRDDATTEHAVDMGRPTPPAQAGAGRAINAAFLRHRSAAPGGAQGGTGDKGQEQTIEGPGYPSEDLDDVEPDDEDDLDDDEEEGEDGEESRDRIHEEGLETGDGMLEELLTPPGGDALGGDRDADPNLNGGHGIRMQAPEEGPVPIEAEPTDLSIIGHGHEDKAAWNRDRVAHLQEMENDERDIREATSEQAGLGGAAVAGVLEGWEGGIASPTLDQGDDAFDAELSEEGEVLGDMRLGDADDVLRDASIADPNNTPFLPEHRELPDEDLSLEERLLATPGEDVLSSGPELGVAEELEMEDLNQTDSISRRYEDGRDAMDSAMDGNERRGRVENRGGVEGG